MTIRRKNMRKEELARERERIQKRMSEIELENQVILEDEDDEFLARVEQENLDTAQMKDVNPAWISAEDKIRELKNELQALRKERDRTREAMVRIRRPML